MTQKEVLTAVRKIAKGVPTDIKRTDLQSYACYYGRHPKSVKKASTMRLAMWLIKGTSAV